MASLSSSRNWVYDVFPSFSGEDIRVSFLSHFLKELDRKLIIAFKDNEIERSQPIGPELVQAIRTSRIAVVVFSRNYASSSWCLNELLVIVKCKKELGQLVIPIFYGLDPSHVRKQTGDFGKIFEETCHNKKEEVKIRWRAALTNVANIFGYHFATWGNEAKMIEAIVNDILSKVILTPSRDFDNFVGIKNHIAKMSVLLYMKSKEVRMVGIWGSSGIGKTTIARVLFNRLSRHFQGSIYIDRCFVSKSVEIYSKGNPDDYNMKLHLQESFLSRILDKKGIEVNHLGAVKGKLKNMKVLIFIDDLDNQVVLDTLVGGEEWFGPGSRIILITKDKHILRGHGIKFIYEVSIPSGKIALQMFCRYAFRKNSPPDGFMELASEFAMRVGGLPLGLSLLGSSMRGRNKKYWVDMLPTLQKGLDGKIEKALRVSYDGLERKEYKTLFRHIACFFNGYEINDIKLMLADSDMNIDIGLEILVDKSLISVIPSLDTNIVEMHCLVEEMDKEIVCAQSGEPGEREFLIDSKNVCDVLEDNTGTKNVIGISLDIDEIDELRIHKKAFQGMRNLRFLNIYSKKWDQNKKARWKLHRGFDHLPPKLRLLRLDGYPMRFMPSNFCPENLVKIQMQGSKLEKLWEGVHPLKGLKIMDLQGSRNVKEIPDLSMAINLEILCLNDCISLVELPSFIRYLNKLKELDVSFCEKLLVLPAGMNLESLERLILRGCSRLKTFPHISTNISVLNLSETAIGEFISNLHLKNLVELDMSKMKDEKLWEKVQPLTPLMVMLSSSLTKLSFTDIPSLVELPSSFQNLYKLGELSITDCINLETLPTGMNFESLGWLDLLGCSRLSSFPDISTNITVLFLKKTGIEEVPWWIEKFSNLRLMSMWECKKLKYVSLNISKLKHLETVDFSDCGALTEASLNDRGAMKTDNIHSKLPFVDEASSYSPYVMLSFCNCFNLYQEPLFEQQAVLQELILSGEEVPSYFTHRTTGSFSSLTIPLLHSSLLQPFFRFRVCAVVVFDSMSRTGVNGVHIHVNCRFKGLFGNVFDSFVQPHSYYVTQKGSHLFILDCRFPLHKDDAPLVELIYDHVDIQLHTSNTRDSTSKIKGWGIRLFEERSSPENRLGNSNTLPHVCEVDDVNMVNEASALRLKIN